MQLGAGTTAQQNPFHILVQQPDLSLTCFKETKFYTEKHFVTTLGASSILQNFRVSVWHSKQSYTGILFKKHMYEDSSLLYQQSLISEEQLKESRKQLKQQWATHRLLSHLTFGNDGSSVCSLTHTYKKKKTTQKTDKEGCQVLKACLSFQS